MFYGKDGIRTKGDGSDATIADGREDGADKVHWTSWRNMI